MIEENQHSNDGNVWIVNAHDEVSGEDLSKKLIEQGIWKHGVNNNHLSQNLIKYLQEIQIGDRITIASYSSQKDNLPFEANGHTVRTMTLKARGFIVNKSNDNLLLNVKWEKIEPNKKWFFYTHPSKIWKLNPNNRFVPKLINFIFHDHEQKYDSFLEDPFWKKLLSEKNSFKWKETLQKIIINLCQEKNSDIFTRQELIKFSKDDLKERFPNGKTIDQTISRCLQELIKDDFLKYLERGTYQVTKMFKGTNMKNEFNDECNIIYYGPPGTGKTYEVLSLIEKFTHNIELPQKASLDFNRTFWHLAPGRNEYLWEELKSGNRLGYKWCDKNLGDLRQLDSSIESYQIKKRFSEIKKGDYFCIIRGKHCLGIAESKEDYSFESAQKGNFDFQTLEVDWIEQFDTPILLNSSHTPTFSRLNYGTRWETLKQELFEKGFNSNQPIEHKKSLTNHLFTTFHQSYSYEDFVEGIKPQISADDDDNELTHTDNISYVIEPGVFYRACDKAAQLAGYSDLKNALEDSPENRYENFSNAPEFCLIIDEINRGNVASIFGELITLIEKNKRLGSKEEVIVTLPYSKSEFAVPSNLIIIGTMNTADKSIESLDSALRRRFYFIDKYPDPHILDNNDNPIFDQINLKNMLLTINRRIEILLDKDHTIGHSYLMNITNLNDLQIAFKNKIIPLLEEYFFGETKKIGFILGPEFVKKEENSIELFGEYENTSFSDLNDKEIFTINIPDNFESFKSIYENHQSI